MVKFNLTDREFCSLCLFAVNNCSESIPKTIQQIIKNNISKFYKTDLKEMIQAIKNCKTSDQETKDFLDFILLSEAKL